MKTIKWIGPVQYADGGILYPGKFMTVPDEVADKWISQGYAEQFVETPQPVIVKSKKEAKHGRH